MFYKVFLKILSYLYCVKSKEVFLEYAQTRSWKEEQVDLKLLGLMVVGINPKNRKGKQTQQLPTWRFEDSNFKQFSTLKRDGGFVYVVLPMNFWDIFSLWGKWTFKKFWVIVMPLHWGLIRSEFYSF